MIDFAVCVLIRVKTILGANDPDLLCSLRRITIPDAPNREVAIQVIDRREMETVSPMGRIGRWTRC